MATEHAPTASEYIVHHLTFLTNQKQVGLVDWSVLHLDTLFYSIGLGLLAVFFMARLAARATSGVPGRMQAAVEIVIEMVSDQAKGIVHSPKSREFVAPLALTVFVWIFLTTASRSRASAAGCTSCSPHPSATIRCSTPSTSPCR